MVSGLTFRQSYYEDPKAWEALVDLLRDTFGIDVGLQMNMGGYDPSCMPFGWFDHSGVLVANLSAFTMPMMINGEVLKAAAFQSGAVRPDWQRQGLYRDVMRKAFDWSNEQGFDFGILLTDKPAMYEPSGFKAIPQSVFVATDIALGKEYGEARKLSLQVPADLALIQQKLKSRVPVSQRFAVVRQAEMFTLNTAFDASIQLFYLSHLDVIAAIRQSDDRDLHLLDIVGSHIPSLTSLLAELALDVKDVRVYFPPDQIDIEVTPGAYNGYCALMIRGDIGIEEMGPVILSPMAEF